jgi:hypothetical protein
LQKSGVVASSQYVPGSNTIHRLFTCSNTFKNGELSKSSMCASAMEGARYLDKGWKVFMTKMDVDIKKHKITFTLIECDSCNGLTTPSNMKSTIVFEFADKFLDTAEPGQITDIIGQVLKPDPDATKTFASGGAPAPAAAQAPAAAPAVADAGPIAPPAAAPTQQVQIGDTTQRVVAILGNPPVVLNGANGKLIYKYPSLKVVFSGGKVVDFE